MNNDKAFPSLDGMGCSYPCPDQLQRLPGRWQAKRYWISLDFQKHILLEGVDHEQSSKNNQSTWQSSLKYKEIFSKNALHGWTNIFERKNFSGGYFK